MKRYIMKLGLGAIMIGFLCTGCTYNEVDTGTQQATETETINYENDFQSALELLSNQEYEEAEQIFKTLGNYEDSFRYASYAAGMCITVEARPIKASYDAFVKAGNIEDAAEYAEALKTHVDNCPGIYRCDDEEYGDDYLVINEELEVGSLLSGAEEEINYLYEVLGKMNSHYKIISDIGFASRYSDDFHKLDFSKDFQNVQGGYYADDTFYKITEEEYNDDVVKLNNETALEELRQNLLSYPKLDLEETLEVLVGNTFEVNEWSDIAEYTFYDNNTYEIKTENENKIYDWRIEDGRLHGGYYIEEENKWQGQDFSYDLYKYLDGKYLIYRYDWLSYIDTIFIADCLTNELFDGRDPSLEEKYFYECPEIMTPDAVDRRFTYEYTEQKDDIILHTYSIEASSTEEASNIIDIYYDYLRLDKNLRDLEYDFKQDDSSGIFYITEGHFEHMVATMNGGKDSEIGYFITCSMEERTDDSSVTVEEESHNEKKVVEDKTVAEERCSICGGKLECAICGEDGLYCENASYGSGTDHYCGKHWGDVVEWHEGK